MHTTQYLGFSFTYLEGFIMNTGNKNKIVANEDLSFSQQLTCSPLVFDSEKEILHSSTE